MLWDSSSSWNERFTQLPGLCSRCSGRPCVHCRGLPALFHTHSLSHGSLTPCSTGRLTEGHVPALTFPPVTSGLSPAGRVAHLDFVKMPSAYLTHTWKPLAVPQPHSTRQRRTLETCLSDRHQSSFELPVFSFTLHTPSLALRLKRGWLMPISYSNLIIMCDGESWLSVSWDLESPWKHTSLGGSRKVWLKKQDPIWMWIAPPLD